MFGMRRFKQIVLIALAARVLAPVGLFMVICINEDTLPRRTAQWDADLRAEAPPGSDVGQLREWLIANGFGRGYYDLDGLERWAAKGPRFSGALWCRDPAWLSSADVFIEVTFDEQGRVQSTRVTSQSVSF